MKEHKKDLDLDIAFVVSNFFAVNKGPDGVRFGIALRTPRLVKMLVDEQLAQEAILHVDTIYKLI